MSSIQLKSIPKPEPGSRELIDNPNEKESLIRIEVSETVPVLYCQQCNVILTVGIEPEAIWRKALLCNSCGAYNTMP